MHLNPENKHLVNGDGEQGKLNFTAIFISKILHLMDIYMYENKARAAFGQRSRKIQ